MIPPISVEVKRKVAELMLIERENVDILSKPYLSVVRILVQSMEFLLGLFVTDLTIHQSI